MKKFLTILFFSFLFLGFFMPISFESVIAYQDGDLYICDFQQYAVGTQEITEFVSGEQWLGMELEGTAQKVDIWSNGCDLGKGYGYFGSCAGIGREYTYWNFTGAYKNVSFNCYKKWSYEYNVLVHFYCGNNLLGYINFLDNAGAGPNDYIRVYAGDEVMQQDTSPDSAYMNVSCVIHSNDSLCITVQEKNDNSDVIGWEEDLGGFTTITRFRIRYSYDAGAATSEFWHDNITLNTAGGIDWAWDVDYDSFGSVTESYYSALGFQLTATNPYAGSEIQKSNVGLTQSGLTVRQIALAVDEGTDYSLMEINAMFNGHNFGDFHSSYTVNISGVERYILVWQNLNQFFLVNDALVEFQAVRLSGTINFKPLLSSSDIDGDDDEENYYWGATNSPDYFNGVYDGVILDTSDLMYMVWYNTTGEGGEYGGAGLEGYSVIGDLFDYEGDLCISNLAIEGTYNVENSHKVKAVDLLVTQGMYDRIVSYQEPYTKFKCNVNGETDEEVNSIFPFADGVYTMRWIFDTSVKIENESINVSFYTPDSTFGAGKPLSWCIKISTDDSNGDNLVEFRAHNSIVSFENGNYDGTIYDGYDIVYRVYYEQEFLEPQDYEDWISVDKLTYEQYDLVKIQGCISDEAMPYSVHAYYNDGGWNEFIGYGYPVEKIEGSTFLLYLTAIYQGPWNVTLFQDTNVVAVAWFNVTGKDVDYAIITVPNPSKVGESVNIYALYNFSDNYDVRILVETDWRNYHYDVVTKQALHYVGSITFVKEGIYSVFMQRRFNDSYYYWSEIIEVKHIVRSKDYECELSITKKVLGVGDIQVIWYQHNHLGNIDVRLVINDKLSGIPIYDQSFGTINYKCTKVGTYKAGMVLLKENGDFKWLVDNVTWICGDEIVKDAPILPDVDYKIGIVLGTIVTAVFAMFPVILSFMFGKSPQNIPPLVYGFTTAIGLVFSVGLGFYGAWVIFVFVAVGIIISFLVWFKGRSA